MTKYAKIVNGMLDTISFNPPRGWIEATDEEPGQWGDVLQEWVEVPDDVFGGFTANADGTFSPPDAPPESVPESVTARQFKMQLVISDLKPAVDAWVSQQDELTQVAYEYSGNFVRTETMMQRGFTALGFSESQRNAFFLAASKL